MAREIGEEGGELVVELFAGGILVGVDVVLG